MMILEKMISKKDIINKYNTFDLFIKRDKKDRKNEKQYIIWKSWWF